jgi:hypothetical protein
MTIGGAVMTVPREGAGTELKKLLAELAVHEKAGCQCAALANDMNIKGIDWCEQHRDALADSLREHSKQYGWQDKLRAAKEAIKHGLVFNPLDPYPGLIAEAIRRAKRDAT